VTTGRGEEGVGSSERERAESQLQNRRSIYFHYLNPAKLSPKMNSTKATWNSPNNSPIAKSILLSV
jgi:hypothetical protein